MTPTSTAKSSNKGAIPSFVKKAVVIASLGGILFGYDLGVISGALPQLKNEFDLSESQQEMIVSFLFLGGAVGSTVGGTLCDTTGRKNAIFITDILFIIGAVALFTAQSFIQIIYGRILVGFAVAVSGIADVAYLHEISPVEWRGAIVSVNEACISLGFLVSYFAGYGISQVNDKDGWRYMFVAGSFIAIFQLIGMAFMPESPVWLKDKGRFVEAKIVLARISGSSSDDLDFVDVHHDNGTNYHRDDAVEDYGLDQRDIDERPPMQNSSESSQPEYYSTPEEGNSTLNVRQVDEQSEEETDANVMQKFRSSYRQVIIAIFLSVMQQFCGHPNILNFAPEIFAQVGVPSLFSTLLLGVLKFVTTCIVIWKIEQFGRRSLLLLGLSIITVSLLLLTIAFAFEGEDGDLPMATKFIAIIGIFGVAGGYACSFGPLTWLLVSELFPSSIRGRALGGSTITSYCAGAIVSYSFLSVQTTFGPSAPFTIYFILTLLSIGFAYVAIPDTAGKDPDSIQLELEERWSWRRRGESFQQCKDDDPKHLQIQSNKIV
eukprot:CAMPEP_0203674324 /NCGR_PEP_ID=MMETSP0090-20130426/15760_1 /ASSEMBLY_ACC=CAM_ASM_001088 /TAXON_ID=426623 /ORGANISM="Chaetoceros affinis, Strain CCMP159" /LENGTH=545 /DNA_ID=CAMNT_0050540177 /DNA_START=42 /DNA_END=1679 /DNA_ORIENTATION=-